MSEATSSDRARGLVTAGVIAAAAFAVAVVALTIFARRAEQTIPTGDMAVLEGYVQYALHGRLLVGPYSRFGWHHPGPMFFYLVSPMYAASGDKSVSLNAAALAIGLGSILLIVFMSLACFSQCCSVRLQADRGVPTAVYRGPAEAGHYGQMKGAPGRTGGVFAIAAAAMCLVYAVRAGQMLVSPWNPYVLVLPLMAFAVACAAIVAGRIGLLPLAALLGSFAVQTHVGGVPTAVILTMGPLAVMGSIVVSGTAAERSRLVRLTGATLVLLAILWLPTAIEQLTHAPGNLTRLADFFTSQGGNGQPFRKAFVVWADMLTAILRPDFAVSQMWSVRRGQDAAIQGWAIAQITLLGLSVVWSAVRRRREQFALTATLFAASCAALWSITRIEAIEQYQVFWISGLGVLNTAALVDVAYALVTRRERPVPPRVLQAACGVLLAASAVVGARHLQAEYARASAPTSVATSVLRVAEAIRDYTVTQRISRPVIFLDQPVWEQAAGVILQLQKAGVPYAAEKDWEVMFTDAATPQGDESVGIRIVGAAEHVRLGDDPRAVVIARRDPIFAHVVSLVPHESR